MKVLWLMLLILPGVIGGEDRKKCVNDFIGWCNSLPKSQRLLQNKKITKGESRDCFLGPKGYGCKRNEKPWFHCTTSKSLMYKGKPLTKDSAGDTEICFTKESAFLLAEPPKQKQGKVVTKFWQINCYPPNHYYKNKPTSRSESPQECVKEFIDWCKQIPKKEDFVDNTVITGGATTRCILGKYGHGCLRDGTAWFNCTSDKVLSYKGKKLLPDFKGDDEICKTKMEAKKLIKGKYSTNYWNVDGGKKDSVPKVAQKDDPLIYKFGDGRKITIGGEGGSIRLDNFDLDSVNDFFKD